jgi:hypothetical protein
MVTIAGGVLLAPTSEKFSGDEVAAEVVLLSVLRCPEVWNRVGGRARVRALALALALALSLARACSLSLCKERRAHFKIHCLSARTYIHAHTGYWQTKILKEH